MPYNLLTERWMPVRRADGSLDRIAPHEVVPTDGESPPATFAAARPDFDGALAQFMVGLLQTASPPSSDDDWADRWETPPASGELHGAFAPLAEAFDLDGAGPRFLQDHDADLGGTTKPAAYLLLETPTDNTLRNNADHFVKDRTDGALSLPVAAQALLSFQLNAPSGGRGHRTSLRGGGPMTTIVTADTVGSGSGGDWTDAPLWRTLWLNVLSADVLGPAPDDLSLVFPWLGPTRASLKGTATEETVPGDDAHPLQAFWGTPRRVRLSVGGPAVCAVTGETVDRSVATYETASYGVNYAGPWNHLLSPHRVEDDGDRTVHRAYLTEAHRLAYADWLGFALGSTGGRTIRPATAVRAATERAAALRRDVPGLDALGLWAFGFDADNMKIRAWQDSRFPLLAEPPEAREVLLDHAQGLVTATAGTASALRTALKKALYGSPSRTAKGKTAWDFPFHIDKDRGLFSKSVFTEAETQLWADTQDAFFSALGDIRSAPDDPGRRREVKHEWVRTLQDAALTLFDRVAAPDQQHHTNPAAVSLARATFFSPRLRKSLLDALGIDPEPAHA